MINIQYIRAGLLHFCLLLAFTITAQQNNFEYRVEATKIQKLGTTKALTELVAIPSTSHEKKLAFKRKKKRPKNFIGRGASKVTLQELEHQGPDPIRQTEMGQIQNGEILVNIDGLVNGGSPHDPSGDIGTTHYIQAVNATRIGIFEKDGTLVNSFSGNTLWTEFNKNGAGDPIILFDEMAKRWFITEFADPADILIAISDTEDPLGSYTAYNFSTPNFPDYPKYAIWPNALVMTSNEQGAGQLHNYFIERDSLLAGADNVTMQRLVIEGSNSTEAGFYVTTPLDFDGSELPVDSLPVVMKINDSSWGGVAQDQIELFTFDIDWNDQNNTVMTQTNLVTTPFDSYPCSAEGFGFACVPQLGGGGLDAIPEVIMNIPQYRNFGTHESIVLCFITDATDGMNQSAIRWMELRRTEGEDWSIYQEGTYAPDGLDRYMGSIAIDKNGNIALGYNVSSPDDYVGVRFTGRFANDPLGVMTFEEQVIVDGSGSTNGIPGRFGDYSQMSVDPIDETTFWFTTEYGGSNGTRTRIASFQLQKNNFDAAPLVINSPESSSALTAVESVTVTVSNAGLNDIENLQVGLLFNGETLSTFMVPDTLSENETYEHTFDTTIDLSALGEYTIGTYTSFELDENVKNDTIYKQVKKLAEIDGALAGSESIETCNPNKQVTYTITNNGSETITEATLAVVNNGLLISTETYTGSITTDNSAEFDVTIMDLQDGDNEIVATITTVNGTTDQVPENNVITKNIKLTPGLKEFTLLLTTDEYPIETSWILSNNQSGTTLDIGGGYMDELFTYKEVFCLDDDMCYEFKILDSQGDGICCNFGEGSYQILDEGGNVIINENGSFGSSQTVEFCAQCVVSSAIEITNASAMDVPDGAILLTATGGIEPYQYSIDGGTTFQESPIFENLLPGDYEVVVTYGDGSCEYREVATVDFSTSTIEVEGEYAINVSPNPGNGFYHVEILNYKSKSYSMRMQVIDANGRFVQEMPLQKYNGTFHGDLSLVDYPKGIYYLRFLDQGITKMSRLVKI